MDETFDAQYYNTVDQIYHAQWSLTKLSRQELLRHSIHTLWPHGHPTRLIQIAGTSGKGSTCRFLEAGLQLVSKAGAFTGPHLFDYCERFSIAGQTVARADVTAAWETVVKPHALTLALNNPHHTLSFHEIGILIALTLFDWYRVEWGVIETGIGGRYDQTTALTVVATALTNVGRDHEHLLGAMTWQRALDKAGIARQGVPLFTSERTLETLQIIAAVCRATDAPLYVVDHHDMERLNTLRATISSDNSQDTSLLASTHQQWNATLALALIQHVYPEIDAQQVVRAFASVRFPGRFWQVSERLYADVAHNPDKIGALARELEQRFPQVGKLFVVGVSGQRSVRANLSPLLPLAKMIIVTGAAFKGQDVHQVRAELEDVHSAVPLLVIAEPQQALAVAQAMRAAEDMIILTGSTYIIDQMLNPDPYLRTLNATCGWRTREAQTEGSRT